MINFYRLRAPDQPSGAVVIVADDPKAGILLRWVPNAGLWLRAHALENDFLFGDDGGTYEPLPASEAGALLRRVKPFDERYDADRRLMTRYRALPAAEQRTNAEMGLSRAQTRTKPMSAAGLPELLRRTRRWRTIATYDKKAGSAPRQFVSDWSQRPHPLGLSGLELRVSTLDRHPVVQARAARQPAASEGEQQ